MMEVESWQRLAKAVDYYQQIGYEYVDVPWLVGKKAVDVTIPKDRISYSISDKHLVGSAEQSFIELIQDGKLEKCRRYCACTPCFRDDKLDNLHQQYFMKVELIHVCPRNPEFDGTLGSLVSDALYFYNNILRNDLVDFIKTDIGYDLNLNGIEIGSYGYREFDGNHIIYGTGLAEPRFTIAITKT